MDETEPVASTGRRDMQGTKAGDGTFKTGPAEAAIAGQRPSPLPALDMTDSPRGSAPRQSSARVTGTSEQIASQLGTRSSKETETGIQSTRVDVRER